MGTHPRKCLDMPDHTHKPSVLQAWECNENTSAGELFEIHQPVNCKWDQWTEWSICIPGKNHTSRSRSKVKQASFGGAACVGTEKETVRCNNTATVRLLLRNLSQ